MVVGQVTDALFDSSLGPVRSSDVSRRATSDLWMDSGRPCALTEPTVYPIRGGDKRERLDRALRPTRGRHREVLPAADGAQSRRRAG